MTDTEQPMAASGVKQESSNCGTLRSMAAALPGLTPRTSAKRNLTSSSDRRPGLDRTQEVGGSSPPSSIATEAPHMRASRVWGRREARESRLTQDPCLLLAEVAWAGGGAARAGPYGPVRPRGSASMISLDAAARERRPFNPGP